MPNHFHLIVKQLVDGGITKFMHKLGTGYTLYFNQKYKRTGSLFEGKFKRIYIDKDEYLIHLSRYIHLNPIELIQHDWKKRGIKDWEKVNEFLKNYRWSSYPDYIGKKNFPSVIKKDFLMGYFDKSKEKYEKFVRNWIIEDLKKVVQLI